MGGGGGGYLISIAYWLFSFYQPSVELELWKRFHVFKKVRNISRFDWDRQSRMRDYHLSLQIFARTRKSLNQSTTCFSNLHRRNYCPVNKETVAVRRSDWPRAKWDHAYFKRTTGHFMTRLAAIFWSFVAEAKFRLPLSSSGVFKEFETRQQKKNWRKLESTAGKVSVQNQKLA